jgi:ribokinase
MGPPPDVVVVGDINADIVAPIDHYPEPGGHGLADEMVFLSGGSAANTAASLGRLGVHVAMFGRVGDDPLAERALRALSDASVDLSRVVRDGAALTGLFFVTVTPDGERTMFGGRGANARLSPADLDGDVIGAARWLHLSGYPLLSSSGKAALSTAVDIARQAGVPVSFDAGIGPATRAWRDAVLGLGAAADVLLPNCLEARALTGGADADTAVRKLRTHSDQTVALKRGSRGCLVAAASDVWEAPAFPVDVRDTTGAGDAFNAGFIAGQLAGLGLRASAVLANALGALSATTLGAAGAGWQPTIVADLLASCRGRQPWIEWNEEIAAICAWLRGRA